LLLPSRREVKRLQAELDAARAEHQSYKGQVSSHFHKTAELVGVMTQSYKNVYDHLANGAQSLCDGPPALPAGFGESRMIADSSFVVGDETPEAGESSNAASEQEGPTAEQDAREDVATSPSRDDGAAAEKRDWARMERHPSRASETQAADEPATDGEETRGNGADGHPSHSTTSTH
jgi:hypothetical protein